MKFQKLLRYFTNSILYGIISFGFRYYGEMITYLGMTMPMAAPRCGAKMKGIKSGRSRVDDLAAFDATLEDSP